MQALLSFDQAPPFKAPLRFFLTAPVFGMLAGLLLFLEGPALLASRWTPSALAMTHLLTLGFMLQVMLGALIQVLPVVTGANLPRPSVLSSLVHFGLTLGTLALAFGFLSGNALFLQLGMATLLTAVSVFLFAALIALHCIPTSSPTIFGIKLALPGLFLTIVLGGFLTDALTRGTPFSLLEITDLHAAWGLAAWSGVLLIALAYVVVPMFQLTPGYPARLAWRLPAAISVLVLAWGAALFFGQGELLRLIKALLALLGIVFCGVTLRLQSMRRRAKPDVTSRFWKSGLIASILALLMMLTAAILPSAVEISGWEMAFGVLLLVGGFTSFITGMLYKILPFLAWLHLQNLGQGHIPAPTMSKLLPEGAMQKQFHAHQWSLLLLLAGAVHPESMSRLAGAGLLFSMSMLGWNMLKLLSQYRLASHALAEKKAAG